MTSELQEVLVFPSGLVEGIQTPQVPALEVDGVQLDSVVVVVVAAFQSLRCV